MHKILDDVYVNGSTQNYLIQHSAGSGKTNSIAWLAYRLSSLHDADDKIIYDNIIIITDRVVVDRQLQAAIMGMEHKSGLIKVMDDKCNSADLAIALNGNTKNLNDNGQMNKDNAIYVCTNICKGIVLSHKKTTCFCHL